MLKPFKIPESVLVVIHTPALAAPEAQVRFIEDRRVDFEANARNLLDVALTRAVSALPVLCELTLPLVKVGGKSIAYKGDSAEERAASGNALSVLHATAERVVIPADYGARELVILTKNGTTPKQYPRKAGTPAKNPL